jgi:hypothetical protein
MIVSKNSALKGMALFFWAILAILGLVSGWSTNAFFGICSTLLFAVNGYVIYTLYQKWSKESK